jgi:hypothetical protein
MWQRTFQAPDDWKEPFHPSRITMKHRTLIFTSEECRVHLWMALIDTRIAAANARHARAIGFTTASQATETEGVNDGGRGLQERTIETKEF